MIVAIFVDFTVIFILTKLTIIWFSTFAFSISSGCTLARAFVTPFLRTIMITTLYWNEIRSNNMIYAIFNVRQVDIRFLFATYVVGYNVNISA